MPSDKKRINLTIPDEIYERLQAYKNETGIVNDATACLQLIVQQLFLRENARAQRLASRPTEWQALPTSNGLRCQVRRQPTAAPPAKESEVSLSITASRKGHETQGLVLPPVQR